MAEENQKEEENKEASQGEARRKIDGRGCEDEGLEGGYMKRKRRIRTKSRTRK